MEPNYDTLEELFAQKVINKKAASEKKKTTPSEVILIVMLFSEVNSQVLTL